MTEFSISKVRDRVPRCHVTCLQRCRVFVKVDDILGVLGSHQIRGIMQLLHI
jgi:hypothetical protein